MRTIVEDADELTFEEAPNTQGRVTSERGSRAPSNGTFVGLGPTASAPDAAFPPTPAIKTTFLGPGPVTPPAPSSGQSSNSLKATLVGAMPGMAMVPQRAASSVPPEVATKSDPGSLKATLVGAMPGMSMAPQRANLSSIKDTLGASTLFGPDLAELPADTVFATAFKVVRTMVRGRASVLYEATLQGVGRRHALKVFRRSPGVDEAALQRFVHDARVGSRVESEHLIEVSRAGYDGASGCAWVASDILEGETLATRLAGLKDGATLPVAEAWQVLTGVSRGLAKAHHQGVVHGDLRPSNVLLAKGAGDGFEVKLLDFGVVHLLPAWSDTAADATAWRAPELPSVEITPAADVWSVGLLAFLLFTGHDYWQGSARVERIERQIVPASDRAELLGCASRLPRGFDAWFAQCVSRLPASRFKSARELVPALASLQAAASNVPVIDYTPARGASIPPPSAAPRKVTTRPSAPPPRGDDDLPARPSRPSFAPPSVAPRKAPRSPIASPVHPDGEPSLSRATPISATQNVLIPQGPLKAAALQNATPLHGSPRASWPPTSAVARHPARSSAPPGLSPPHGSAASQPPGRPSPSRPLSPPQGVATHTEASGSHHALSSTGANHALSTTGANRALTTTGANRALSTTGANQVLSTTGANRALSTTGANRALTTSEANKALSASGAQRALTPQGAQAALSAGEEPFALVSPRTGPQPKLALPAPALAPPVAPTPERPSTPSRLPRRAVFALALGAGVLSFTLVGLYASRTRRANTPTIESTPALQTPPGEPVIAPTPTPPRTARRWNGSLTTSDSRWSFVLSLRVNGQVATGWFSWTAAQVPGGRVGEQVRENLEGSFDAATQSFEVHGTASTNPDLLPVNAYRLRVRPDGTLEGSTLDASERIVGAAAR